MSLMSLCNKRPERASGAGDFPVRHMLMLRARSVLVLTALLGMSGCQYLMPAPSVQAPPVTQPQIPVQVAQPKVTMPPAPDDPEPDPAASDSLGVARLMKLSWVWHIVSLHHPFAAGRGVPLDSAFIRAVTLVRRADNADLLRVAYARFLAVLNDPLTRVEAFAETGDSADYANFNASVSGRQTQVADGEIGVERTADSILVIKMPSATRYSTRAEVALRAALEGVPNRVILDMRTAGVLADADSLDAFVARMKLVEKLTPVSFTRSTVRVRRVGGTRNVGGEWRYDDSWLGRDGLLVAADTAVPRRVMVLANSQAVLPRSVLGLIATGAATLIGEGDLHDDALVPSVLIPIGSGLAVRIRTGEVLHVDGSTGVVADTTVAVPSMGNGAVAGTMVGAAKGQANAASKRPTNPETNLVASGATNDSTPAMSAALRFLRTQRVVRASRLPAVRAPAVLPRYYDTDPYPFMGSRILGAARLWSAMRARHAHRDLYDTDIDDAFMRAIPRLEAARFAHEYAAALRDLTGVFDDAQVKLSGASVDSVRGLASAPFRVRWIDGRAVVTDVISDPAVQALRLERGLEVVAIDGYPLPAWVSDHRGMVSASNEWNRLYQLMELLPYGKAGNALLRVRDASGRERQFDVPRSESFVPLLATVERPWQEPSREMNGGVAYIDVNRLTEQTVEQEFERLRKARALILDLRGGMADSSLVSQKLLTLLRTKPSAVVARELHRYQTSPCLAATLREAVQQCPDERELRARISEGDTTGHYKGRIVALIDERTSGAMERLALALEATTDVAFVGSSSAGSPSETVKLGLPGQLSVGIPAAELRRIDGSQWQRIGITPIVDAKITLRAFRMGADDVVERASQWVLEQLDGAPRRRR